MPINRSTDTEDYMKIELASNQTVPPPPPLPPPIGAFTISNGDANGQNSKTNTLNSTASNIPAPPPPQDTATRKQQQPLSAISIQDLNSVQVCIGNEFQTHLTGPDSNQCVPHFICSFDAPKINR